jgi:hypothetical protein
MRQQLGVPEGMSDATLQDMLYAKQPQPQMEEMFSPLETGRNLAPAAIRAGGLIGGGALALGTGPMGAIGAGALNVFADQLATKMEALNKGEMIPDKANPTRVASAFLHGALLSQVPVPSGPLGYVTQGLTNAAAQTSENLISGQPVTQQGVGEAALMGTATHGAFQGVGKALGKVPINVKSMFPAPVEGQRVPMTAEAGQANIGGEQLPKGVTKAKDWPGIGRGYHVDVGQDGPTTIYVPEGEDLIPHLQKTYKDFGIDPSAALKGLKTKKK